VGYEHLIVLSINAGMSAGRERAGTTDTADGRFVTLQVHAFFQGITAD